MSRKRARGVSSRIELGLATGATIPAPSSSSPTSSTSSTVGALVTASKIPQPINAVCALDLPRDVVRARVALLRELGGHRDRRRGEGARDRAALLGRIGEL